eukprot:CAMPEP_0170955470 /NCGR_PEP_ID=MMETSP0735-20130129/33220_1 /TAXON_ID=186038 /ORGANISM="Fragilariopsis kerguelensis, Strain L26-C5" /LENGTH=147 /DNA_ID=CAMNT_0011367391 /DNA_START=74 /DNA_END=514 /DNA_ORIENTATION=-
MGKKSKRNKGVKSRKLTIDQRSQRQLEPTSTTEIANVVRTTETVIKRGDRVKINVDDRGWINGVVRMKGIVQEVNADDGSNDQHPQRNLYIARSVYKVALDYKDIDPRGGRKGSLSLGNGHFLEQVTVMDNGRNIVWVPHKSEADAE